MFTYAAEPGTRSAESLDLLASWAATTSTTGEQPVTPAPRPDHQSN